MSEFSAFFRIGIGHILDPTAYDHLLFIVALCLRHTWQSWKPVAAMVTGFTLGHSLTLALATLRILAIPSSLVEFLIPVTIAFTAALAVATSSERNLQSRNSFFIPIPQFILAMVFGLIHGVGFSEYLKALLGSQSSIIIPLVAFNIGVEVAQLGIVAAMLLLWGFMLAILRVKRRTLILVAGGIVLGIAITLIHKTWPI